MAPLWREKSFYGMNKISLFSNGDISAHLTDIQVDHPYNYYLYEAIFSLMWCN